ncbi:hypothetical protein V144x_42560 [Gimesia aquarii]|uniref:Uncharacterized protein n=2 Tax=Gimesia aquarii TaxID=2527964 RepID=A0A517W0H3_9PLAN|nr:hypothetical protein V144x_42560 [Gimesia aquarii]
MKTTGSGLALENTQYHARFQNKVLWAEQDEALDQALIANLSNRQIHQMSRDELVRVIWAANLDFLDLGSWHRVSHFERNTLERLAYLARFCCQNQMSRTSSSRKESHARFSSKNQ